MTDTLPLTRRPGYAAAFAPGRLTLGLLFPIEAYRGDLPSMTGQESLAATAEQAGFAALWVRDVPLRVPHFGDTGQIHDPWVYLAWIAAHTRSIALGTASIVLPLRHPLHTAKAAASIDQLSGGRLLLGVASGDRPEEYPAFGFPFDQRQTVFRDHLATIRKALGPSPSIEAQGLLGGIDLLPKPVGGSLPILVTGHSGQSLEWIAREAAGWLTYPRIPRLQQLALAQWRSAVDSASPGSFKPFAQSLYIDLTEDPAAEPRPIHLGWSLGREALLVLLEELESMGVNHVILNLKYGQRPASKVVEELAMHVVPRFSCLVGERPCHPELSAWNTHVIPSGARDQAVIPSGARDP